MAVPLEKFVQQLEDSGILAGDTLKDFLPPKASPKSAEDLAKELVRNKKLTKFQAEEVSRGKGKSLTLGNYVLMEKIGEGGMGQVFKARHKVMNRAVAVKVLPTAMTKDKAAIDRFHREVQAAAKLRHINIVAADDADQANGVHFLVMELVEGNDLSALVKKDGPFSLEKAVNYILQAAKGLEFAHAEGIVHRDIKPANLLLDKKGTVKILDMGLARIHGDGDDAPQADLTSTGTIMGTVDYMAPEQALDTKTADARADIYALGCSLFYLLTGTPTYQGDTLMKKLLAHRDQPIPSLRSGCPEVPEQLEVVFRKMVAKNIDDRYQTMTEVISALEGCNRGSTNRLQDNSNPTRTVNTSSTRQLSLADASPTEFVGDIPAAKSPRTKTLTNGPSIKLSSAFLKDQKKLLMIGGAFLGVMVLLAIVIVTLKGSDTKLIVTVNEPDAIVEVLNAEGHVEVTRKGDATPIKISIEPGKHQIRVQKDGFELFTDHFVIKNGGEKLITAKLVPVKDKPALAAAGKLWQGWPADAPPPAIAPFDAEQAKKHQEAWARHLGVPVEYTNTIGMKFRLIPPGEFTMGSTPTEIEDSLKYVVHDKQSQEFIKSEAPQHKVILTQPIYLGVNEVMQAEYEKVKGINPSHFAPMGMGKDLVAGMGTTSHPVEMVSWNDAAEFCAKLSEQEKLKPFYFRSGDTVTMLKERTGYRLPTEAEWEFACRAGTTTKYWIGDNDEDLVQAGWYNANSGGRTHTVGELKANLLGLYDIHGNVWEWVQDGWEPTYYGQFLEQSAVDPGGPSSGSQRVVRGGPWLHLALNCRSSYRHAANATVGYDRVGFRVSLAVDAVRQALSQTSSTAASPGKLFMHGPAFPQWVKDVQAMPAEKQVEAVSKKLMELNPGFDGQVTHKVANSVVTELNLTVQVSDLAPVRAFAGLKVLDCGSIADITKPPSPVSDLSPLAGLQLTSLNLNHSKVSDLLPLQGMPLENLRIWQTQVSDLSPLKGMPLATFICSESKVTDLLPLKGAPLVQLNCDVTAVSDLSPLVGMPLVELKCERTKVMDLSPLKGTPLKRLTCDFKADRDSEVLRSIKTLEHINSKPAAEFWKEVEEQQKGKKLGFQMPGFDQWVKDVQAMPAEKQVEAVSKKLVELNPDFDGKVTHFDMQQPPLIENGVVIAIGFSTVEVTDISPIRALGGLKLLNVHGTQKDRGIVRDLSPLKDMQLVMLNCDFNEVSDLSPLKGMSLGALNVYNNPVADLSPLAGMQLTFLGCGQTKVSNLSPLQGMPLNNVNCVGTFVSDLSPLKGMSLKEVWCSDNNIKDLSPLQGMPLEGMSVSQSDLSPLEGMNLKYLFLAPDRVTKGVNVVRNMKSLKKIGLHTNGEITWSPEEFWKKYDAGEFGKP